ncbi:MAG TPA: hypothetical protein VHB78_10380 [Vicinamibacterales bacterium]|jgi:glutamyl-tRNA reductase|nr:hypothetical protein [Vicinamibacterales bacterium]
MRLALVHRPRRAAAAPLPGTVWATCLREVQFLGETPHAAGDAVVADEDAYVLLLEIVCGLRSPLLGETEVQAQFKQFLSSLDPADGAWLRRLGQRVLTDAKQIRSHHLQGFGAHSYGQLALRHTARAERLVVIGAGALARDVLAHARDAKTIDVWSRQPADEAIVSHVPAHARLIADARSHAGAFAGATAIIVAAPVSGPDLDAIVSCYRDIVIVIDLRASDEVTALARPVRHLRLTDLMAQHAEADGLGAIQAAKTDIRRFAREYAADSQTRPFGWDDLCA